MCGWGWGLGVRLWRAAGADEGASGDAAGWSVWGVQEGQAEVRVGAGWRTGVGAAARQGHCQGWCGVYSLHLPLLGHIPKAALWLWCGVRQAQIRESLTSTLNGPVPCASLCLCVRGLLRCRPC